MRFFLPALICAYVCGALPAAAEYQQVQSQSDFVRLIDGKTLTRPLVTLQVTPRGAITGMGAVWEVTGTWEWKDGFFCRSLIWGGDDLGYNCQAVAADGARIRFTSDQGRGESAEFRLR